MKQLLFLLSVLFWAIQGNSQTSAGYSRSTIHFRYDMPSIGGTNANGDSVHGDAAMLKYAIDMCSGTRARTLYIDSGTYRIDTSAMPSFDNIHIVFAPNARFVSTSAFVGYGSVIEVIAHSNVVIENYDWTNWHSKGLYSFINFKSSPRKSNNIKLLNGTVHDSWAQAGVMMGQTGSNNDSTHWYDNVLFDGCVFTNLWNPAYQVITYDLHNDALHCRGINLQQTTLRCQIKNCRFENTSGDGVYGYGSNYGMRNNKYVGSWEILNCDFLNNFMNVEILGPYYGANLNIHNNRLYYSTYNGGYNLSIQSRRCIVKDNDFLNADRTFIEYGSVSGVISGNTGKLVCWSDTSHGVQPTQAVSRVSFIEGYGFNNAVHDNTWQEDKSNPNTYSAGEFNGIKLIARANGGNVNTEDTTFGDAKYRAAYWYIYNNALTGSTNRVLDVTNEAFDYVTFTGNFILTNAMKESPMQIWGSNWVVVGNVFNLYGCYPTSGNACIKLFSKQTTSPNAVVANNITWNSAWKTKYWFTGASATNVFKDSQ